MNQRTARLLRRYAYAVKIEAKGLRRPWHSMASRKYIRALETKDFTRATEPTQ